MQPIKVITVNILHGGEVMENLLPFLQKENADILLLQEVNNAKDISFAQNYRSVSVIQDKLSYRFSHFAPLINQIFPFGEVEMGNAIFSRFPIISDEVIFYNAPYDPAYKDEDRKGDYSKDPCNLQKVVLQIEKKEVTVLNTHGIWELSGKDTPERLAMSELIIKQIKNHEHIILGGDFNVQPNTKTIENIEKHLTNVFKDELTSTFNMKRKTNPGYATAVVDMLFVSPHIKILNKSCPQVDVSDHLPLIATLSIT